MNEVSLVLKSVTILISALKKAQQSPSASGMLLCCIACTGIQDHIPIDDHKIRV